MRRKSLVDQLQRFKIEKLCLLEMQLHKKAVDRREYIRNAGCVGVYFVPAFGGLLAPQWRSDARGVILGISSFTTRAHIVRALLEAIAWQVRSHAPC